MKEYPKKKRGSGNSGNRSQSSLVDSRDSTTPRENTFGASGGANGLHEISSRHEKENSQDVVTSMIKFLDFDVYAFMYPRSSFSFVTFYVANYFDVIAEKHYEPFCVSTPVGEFSLAEQDILIVLFPSITKTPWFI